MPPATGAKGRGKDKNPKGSVPPPATLQANERLIEVRLRATIADAAAVPETALRSVLHCVLHGQERALLLGDAFHREEEVPVHKGRNTPRPTPPTPAPLRIGAVDFVLAQLPVQVDPPALEALLGGADTGRGPQNFVALHAPPPPPPPPPPEDPVPVAAAATGAKKGAAKSVKDARTAAAPSPAPGKVSPSKGRPKSSGAGQAKASTELTGERLSHVHLSLIDVMRCGAYEYPLPVSIAGVTDVRVVLCCQDGGLAPPSLLKRLRPVCFTLRSVDNLPAVSDPQPAVTTVVFQAFGHRVETPPLTAGVRGVAVDPHTKKPILFRAVRFLGSKDPLGVYQCALLEAVQVSVYSSPGSGEASAFASAPTTTPVGTGAFSVHGLVADNQTLFNETVALLPGSRAAAAASGARSCLAAGSSVTCSVDFFAPLPPLLHVDEEGRPVARDSLLTRGVAVLPCAAPWMAAAIGCLLRQLLAARRADCDVRLYVEPPPPPPPMDAALQLSASHLGSVGDDVGTGVSSSKHAGRKGGPAASQGKKHPTESNTAAEAPQAEAEPPVQLSPFEQPTLRVISPSGISGFEVNDGCFRVICLEGPAQEVHRIFLALHNTANAVRHKLDAASPSENGDIMNGTGGGGAANSDELRLLLNPELFVGRRLYAVFPPLVTPPANSTTPPPQAAATTPDPAEASDLAEIDELGGGCGGRIHRIRLCQSLPALMAQQRFLLRRTLSDGCLHCLLQLDALVACSSLREAVARDLFPCAASVVSLERSFGQTLELADIFGADAFVDHSPVAGQRDRSPRRRDYGAAATPPLSDISGSWGAVLEAAAPDSGGQSAVLELVSALDGSTPNAVGHLISFQGRMLVSKKRRIPPTVAARYPTAQWMVSDGGVEVLCAFGAGAPNGTIRHHVEGQVVEAGHPVPMRMLYVIEFHTLAKSFTSSHNAEYERELGARRRREIDKSLAARSLRLRSHACQTGSGATPCATRALAAVNHGASWRCSGSDDDDDDGGAPLAHRCGTTWTGCIPGAPAQLLRLPWRRLVLVPPPNSPEWAPPRQRSSELHVPSRSSCPN